MLLEMREEMTPPTIDYHQLGWMTWGNLDFLSLEGRSSFLGQLFVGRKASLLLDRVISIASTLIYKSPVDQARPL